MTDRLTDVVADEPTRVGATISPGDVWDRGDEADDTNDTDDRGTEDVLDETWVADAQPASATNSISARMPDRCFNPNPRPSFAAAARSKAACALRS